MGGQLAGAQSSNGRACSPAMRDVWHSCSTKWSVAEPTAYGSLLACVRGQWQTNLTAFLKARKRLRGYPGFIKVETPTKEEGAAAKAAIRGADTPASTGSATMAMDDERCVRRPSHEARIASDTAWELAVCPQV